MSQFFETREETEAWLNALGIDDYLIHDDLTVDVRGHVSISRCGVGYFPVRFGVVGGDFACRSNQMTSLVGAPASVGGGFYCSENLLTSLVGAPVSVGRDFFCNHNKLVTLAGAPTSVDGDFHCGFNQLITLAGAPSSVGGDFYCYSNQLTTLLGAPSSVRGSFYCHSNQLTSLAGAPASVGGDFGCQDNRLPSFAGAPASVGGDFKSDLKGETFYKALVSLFRSGADFSAPYLAGEISAAKAEILSDEMKAITGNQEAVAIPLRKTGGRA